MTAFRPAWWLPSAHLQTLWPTLFRHRPRPATRRERLELPDGDFLDLDWVGGDRGPLVVLFHGLEGSLASPYIRGMLHVIERRGWRGVLMSFRGCSGEMNRLARSYHSGDTGDMAWLFEQLRRREPATPTAAIGYSLGGNALLKWLGEGRHASHPDLAVAVSVPFDLANAADRLQRGLSRLYQWWLLRSLRRSLRAKMAAGLVPESLADPDTLTDFWRFDDQVTAPLHGFRDVHDYYARCSSRRYLAGIEVPTLLLQARDDPFLDGDGLPGAAELPPAVRLELSDRGGHVGFIAADGLRSRYWLEQRIIEFLERAFAAHA